MAKDRACVAPATAQEPPPMGHNGPPHMNLFGLGAAWLRYADESDLTRLAKLHVRIERKERALREMRKERNTIMNRCIRRMRRAAGKN